MVFVVYQKQKSHQLNSSVKMIHLSKQYVHGANTLFSVFQTVNYISYQDQFAAEILIVKSNLILTVDSSDDIVWQLQITLILSVCDGTF